MRLAHSSVAQRLDGIVGVPELADEAEGARGQMQTLRPIPRASSIGDHPEVAEYATGRILHAPQVIGRADEMFALGGDPGR